MMNIYRNRLASPLIGIGILAVLPSSPGIAQTTHPNPTPSTAVGRPSANSIFAAPPPPTDYGQPGGRESAGSRNCSTSTVQNIARLTALVPLYSKGTEPVVGGLTTNANPTFWFYLPFQLEPEGVLEFVLQDANDNYIYQTKITGNKMDAGILSLPLPAQVQLQEDQSYHWHFLLYCQSKMPAQFVSGYIKRVSRPNLARQLANKAPREQVRLYGAAGIWYDALTQLAYLYRQTPQDPQLQQDWRTLMQDIQLPKLMDAPFVPCCVQPT